MNFSLKKSSGPKTQKTWVRELIEFILLVVLVVLPFRYFIAEPYIVSGISMSKTFETGHYLIINKFWHKFSDIERGDVLVFKSPTENKFYIKRAIGLPGETVRIQDSQVFITSTVTGKEFLLTEPYIKNPTLASLTQKLSEHEYFMMGDNRAHSYDSRIWGPLDESLIKGEPVLRLFPFSLLGTMPGKEYPLTN